MNHQSTLPVVSGVAVAVSALAGSLLVGHSARTSLRDLALSRLGNTTHVIVAPAFVRESLVDEPRRHQGLEDTFGDACPIIALEGFVESDVHRSLRVDVFGVDDRFWRLHGRALRAPEGVDAYVSQDLATALSAAPGGGELQFRVVAPSVVPADTLLGRHDDLSRTTLVKVKRVLGREALGDFTLSPRQGAVLAVFVSLDRLQRAIGRSGQVNALLVGSAKPAAGDWRPGLPPELRDAVLRETVRAVATLDDLGIRLRALPERHTVAVESPRGVVSDEVAALATRAASALGLTVRPVLTHLVTTIRVGERQIPYSFVTATTLEAIQSGATPDTYRSSVRDARPQAPQADVDDPPIVLTDWAAAQLDAHVGDQAWLSYATWVGEGRIGNEMARFRVAAIVPTDQATDRDLVPVIPGITGAPTLSEWAPSVSIDHNQFTAPDEAYWRQYGVSPKAFIPIDVGQRLWGTRYGRQTSLRVTGAAMTLEALADTYGDHFRAVASEKLALEVRPVRAEALRAARGSFDLSLPSLVLSLFIIAAGLIVASAGPRPGVEPNDMARSTGVGVGLGLIGAIGYAAVILHGLRTWWIGATGTTELVLHVSPFVLIVGGVCGWILATATLDLSSAGREHRARRGGRSGPGAAQPRLVVPLIFTLSAGPAGLVLVAASMLGLIPAVAGFLCAGGLLLVSAIAYLSFVLHRYNGASPTQEAPGLTGIGFRAAAGRPSRSVRIVALIAASLFLIMSAGLVRPRGARDFTDRRSGAGGYSLVAESVVPVLYDLDTTEGQRAVGLSLPLELPLAGARFTRFRFRPGDDVSQGNLYRAERPRVLGAREGFLRSSRFTFAGSLAETPDERDNPWLLLMKDQPDGAVPVVADLVSLRNLRVGVGGELPITDSRGRAVTLRVVAALDGSVFQRDVVMAGQDFVRLFPDVEGYRSFLVEVEPRWAPALATRLDAQLARLGFETQSPAERLALLQRRTQTLISAFQTLGLAGVCVGLLGLIGFTFGRAREETRSRFSLGAELVWLVAAGVAIGSAAALIALAPALGPYAFYN